MERSLQTLAGAAVLSGALGSLHAFSVLLPAIETATGAGRAGASFVYSAAIVCLTLAIFLSHRLIGRVKPALLAAIIGAAAAIGLAVAVSSDLFAVIVGYGAVFGFANGIGYGLSLERAARSWPDRKGLATGIVTAAYAVGAMLFSRLFPVLLDAGGVAAALLTLAGCILTASGIAAVLFARQPPTALPEQHPAGLRTDRTMYLLWAGYAAGATAGLMAIGHAAGMVAAHGGPETDVAYGAVVIAFANALGGLLLGWLTDRFRPRVVLAAIATLSTAGSLWLAAAASPGATIAGLAVVGLAYGALIAVYPVAAIDRYGPLLGPRAFGRIFTAWGLAGLLGPWLAGAIYDRAHSYTVALMCAAAAAALSGALTLAMRDDRSEIG